MKKQKAEDVIKQKQYKRNIAIVLIAIFVLSFVTRLTPLVQIYEVNFITLLIWKNGLNIFLLSGLLIFIHNLEKKMIQEKIDKLTNKGVDI